jgi:hypothetical protein
MKTAISVFGLIMIFSCNQSATTSKTDQNNFKDLKISDNPDIFGAWTMCATSSNGMMIQMNTCKTIVFDNNGTGHIGNNSLFSENFTWTLKNPEIKITYSNNNPNVTFSDTLYYANFTTKDNRTDLILTHNDYSYYLSK